MRKTAAWSAVLALVLSIFSGAPAQAAAAAKSTITLDAPAYAGKGLATDISVTVCSGTTCDFANRTVTLSIDGKKVKTFKGYDRVFTYTYTSTKTGNHRVQATVAKTSKYKAANSSTKIVKVKTGMLNSSTAGWYSYTQCESSLCSGFPAQLVTNDYMPAITIWLGADDRQGGRTVALQWQSYTGIWNTESSDTASWDDDAGQYYVDLSFDFDSSWCPSSGTQWSYRINMPATAKATQASGYYRELHLQCDTAYPTSGSVVADFDYYDQSYTDAPEDFYVFADDPDDVGFTLESLTCDFEVDDCSLPESWVVNDSQVFDYASGTWEALAVPYLETNYYARAVVIPADGSTPLYSDIFTISNL
mgnify:CR=1 FL=1